MVIVKIQYSLTCFILLMLLFAHHKNSYSQPLTIAYNINNAQLKFGIEKLSAVTALKNVDFSKATKSNIVVVNSLKEANALGLENEFNAIRSEGFQLKKRGKKKMAIIAKDTAGAMYGLLELAEQLEMKKSLDEIEEKTINPKLAFKAIKFNLPWMSYREHESLSLHTETCHDLKFWKKLFGQGRLL
jgi:alpha-glucuronidase